jgi:drug/metabolite transporter (DMT)-like permease
LRRAYLFTMIAVVAWATGPVGNKALLMAQRGSARLQPLQVAFWSVLAGWLALVALLIVRGRIARIGQIRGRGAAVLALMGVFGFLGYPVAINIAFSLLPLPDALVISYLNPVFVVAFQAAAFGALMRPLSGGKREAAVKARPEPIRTAAALVLCMVGVAFIATEGRLESLGAVRSGTGAIAALVAALCWGLYSNLGRFVPLRGHPTGEGAADVQTAVGMAFGLLPLAVVLASKGQAGLPSGYHSVLHLGDAVARLSAWSLIAVVGLINYGAGYTLWIAALDLGHRAGGPHKLPALTYLTLVIAVALGGALLGERCGPGFWQGAALIAAGNLVILCRSKPSGR